MEAEEQAKREAEKAARFSMILAEHNLLPPDDEA